MSVNKLVPNINMFSKLQTAIPTDDFSLKGFGASNIEKPEGKNFKDVLSGLVSNLNNDIQKPDQLLNDYMTGSSDVDIHDVMTAIAKADLGVTMATQMTSKVVAAYNSIMNISI